MNKTFTRGSPLMFQKYRTLTIRIALVSIMVSRLDFVDGIEAKFDFRLAQFSDLIESKNMGIFSLLDEESKLPTHSFAHFTSEVHRVWNGHFRITLPRTSRLKAHREIRDDEGFVVRHYAGGVCYQTVPY